MAVALSASNAMELLAPYDLILDCTDNLPTRYLLSDTAVHLRKPLVSGAAQKFEGQLAVYNLPNGGRLDTTDVQERGPCFRCLFPKPPAPDTVGSCEELGILGAVTGVIGNLQALEAIKLITGLHGTIPSLNFGNLIATPVRRWKASVAHVLSTVHAFVSECQAAHSESNMSCVRDGGRENRQD